MNFKLGAGALAGMAGIAAWIVVTPLDKWLLGSPYDDLALLGKVFLGGSGWLPLGILLHSANGALFGIGYAQFVEPRLSGPAWRRGLLAAQVENATLSVLTPLIDHHHPAIRAGRTGATATPRALLQAVWRHAIFGLVLGTVYGRLQAAGSR